MDSERMPSYNVDSERHFVDQYGNMFTIEPKELARGGQGVVYRTTDPDLAIKQPLGADGEPDRDTDLKSRFEGIRFLPLPKGIPLTFPLSLLKGEPGYVMRLLRGMVPLAAFDFDSRRHEDEEKQAERPSWITAIQDVQMSNMLFHYLRTGSTRRRLQVLCRSAAILGRLHASGLVYGDVSTNNIFMTDPKKGDEELKVWLIDADNLRYERHRGGAGTYTPGLGAPEVVRGEDGSRPSSDCWAFAVMAFRLLTLLHPFMGKRLVEGEDEDDGGGWDDDEVASGASGDLEERAYAGEFPFVDDEDDDSNASEAGLPRSLVLTDGLRRLFQETLGAGRMRPFQRSTMPMWALELARAYDTSIVCPNCGMSYYAQQHTSCPYCDAVRPPCLVVRSRRWTCIYPIAEEREVICLPQRLFEPFSLTLESDTDYVGCLDGTSRRLVPERGCTFPEELCQELLEEDR